MAEIDQDEIEAKAAKYQEYYRKKYLAIELQKALNRDEPIKSLDNELLAKLLATIEEAGIDQREDPDRM